MAEKGFHQTSVRDYNGEVARTRIHVTVLSAGNFAAQAALRAAYESAYAAIINGVVAHKQYGNAELVSAASSADATAERENKWLVQFHDTTTQKKYRIEIPTPDNALKDPNDRAHAEIGDAGVVDAFVDGFEAYAISDAGNAVLVDEITFVGRNL